MIRRTELRSLLICLSLTLFGAGSHAFAEGAVPHAALATTQIDQTGLKAARELMRVIEAEKQFEQTIPLALGQSFEAMIPYFEKLIPAEEKPQFQTFMKSYAAEMSAQLTAHRAEFIELSARTYSRVYTLDEINAMIRFYGTQAGNKFNSTGPQVVTEIMPALMQILMGGKTPAPSAAPDKLAAAREMIRSGGIADMLIGGDLASVVAEFPALPGAGTPAERLEQKRGELLDVLAGAFAARMSSQEINEVSAFFNSALGKQIAGKIPQLIEEQGRATEEFFRQLEQDMQENLQKKLEGMFDL